MNKSSPLKILGFLLVILAVSQFFYSANAFAATHKTKRHTRSYVRQKKAPVTSSAGYADIVIEADSGRILHSTDPERTLHPASLTKMMTLYITFQALEAGKLTLDHRLWVSANAASQSPSKLGLRPGQTIRVEDAILGLVTESANDVAVVLAENIGGTENQFARLMTRQARALGMTRTTFQNPSGLPDPDQITCAADMVRLGYALAYHYPQYYHYFGRDSFTYAGITHKNHNHLMERYEGMDGIKTGYIRASGFNLVASAVRGETRVIGAVMGGKSAASRDEQMENLLNNCFDLCSPAAYKTSGTKYGVVQQGDAGSLDAGDYLDLPKKVAAVFTPPSQQQRPTTTQRYVSAGSSARNPRMIAPPPVQEDLVPPQIAESPQEQQYAALSIPNAVASQGEQPVVSDASSSGDEEEAQEEVVEQKPVKKTKKAEAKAKKKTLSTKQEVKTGRWGIQIGAYTDKALGQVALDNTEQRMPSSLSGSDKALQKVMINGTPTYRARFIGLDEKTARDACSQLISQKQNCLVVLPEKL